MSEEKEESESTVCSPQSSSQGLSTQDIKDFPHLSRLLSSVRTPRLSDTKVQRVQGQSALLPTQVQAGSLPTAQIQMQSANPSQVQSASLVTNQIMQPATPNQQPLLPQASQVQQQQDNTLPPQSHQQYYVHTSVGTGMQGPPAIAPAPAPGQQTSTTTTVSALHQPLMHHIAPQPLAHPGVSPSPMPQYSPQVQVIQSGIPGTPYLQQVYQNAQGQIIMPSNLTIQPAPGMGASPLQQGALNPLNSSIQVITAGKPFQGQITPHMIAGGKATGVIQQNQGGYNHPSIPSTGSQTVLIGQLGGQLGVISSQPPNILPAHSSNQKAGEMHKVNNMQPAAFGQIQPNSITWAAPGAALHSPTLLAQNSPIFIRGSQPGQENLYIQSAPAQPMTAPNNAVVQNITSMPTGQQQTKVRSNMDSQANIQPKVASMRPQLLPSGAQIRPGASVSTQTLVGQQTIAPAQMVAPRSQVQKYFNKVRGKNANNRVVATVNTQTQQAQQQAQQQIILQQSHQPAPHSFAQPVVTGYIASNPSSLPLSCAPNGSMSTIAPNGSMPTLASLQKSINQTNVEAVMQNNRQGTFVHPSIAPIQASPAPPSAVKIAASKPATAQPPGSPVPSSVLSQLSNIVASAVETTITQPSIRSSTPAPTIITTSSNFTTVTPQTQSLSHTNGISSASTPVKTESQPLAAQAGALDGQVEQDQGPSSENCITWKAVLPSSVASSSELVLANGTAPTIAVSAQNGSMPVTAPSGPLTNGNCVSAESNVTPQPQNATGPPKAMVKPQVLTHVIEGFVIHEASEPFPVNRSSILSDMSKVRTPTAANTATVLPQGAHPKVNNDTQSEDSDIKKDSPKGGEMATCEVCGKTDLRSKYKKSKRFCSSACAKRFNVGCTKRVGLFKTQDESPSKKLKDESDGSDGLGESETLPAVNAFETNGDQVLSNMIANPVSILDEEELASTPKVDILKWTVRDVVEFIQNLPGCQDYAEDFELQEIDGQALMLLKADHLMSAMSIKLGPALKICAKIEAMRMDRKETS